MVINVVVDIPDVCLERPCKNGGTCHTDYLVDYYCECKKGYIGLDCEGKWCVDGILRAVKRVRYE